MNPSVAPNPKKLSTPLAKISAIAAVSLFLAACSGEPVEQQKADVIQAVKLAKVSDSPDSTKRTFPAEVSAVKTVDVSFEVSGRLIEENLLTGSLVKKGDLLAKIDPTPFEQRQQEAEARLKQANRDLARTESTFKKGLSSQAQLDNARTTQELAEIALNKANQDLSYTKVAAPFDAQVSERFVENDSYIKAGDMIAKLQDVSKFYFNINVPERLLSRYQEGATVTAEASIISAPHKKYQLEYVEHATQPDPITQTYKVVFAANADNGNLTPGARAVVDVTLGYQSYGDGLLLPFSAVVGNNSEGFHVWKFDPQSSQVKKTQISVLHIESNYALITGDVALGDLVVAAGAAKMRDGLVVKPYQPER